MLNGIKKFAVLGVIALALVSALTMIGLADNGSEDIINGDIVDDNSLNLKDVASLRDRLSSPTYEVYEPYSTYDVDGNGLVNMKDLVMLRRYLANYNFDTNTPSDEFDIGGKKVLYDYTSGDGATTWHHSNVVMTDYEDICSYFERKGYTEYCENTVGELVSVTYTAANDSVATVTYNGGVGEMYVTTSNSGASGLPSADSSYIRVNETTVTQSASTQDNGMCYIIKLADGSFVVIDGGYAEGYVNDGVHKDDAKNVFETLKSLNGGSDDIYVRAWLITHSHGDHYQVFRYFANNYSAYVSLDTLLCSPAARYYNGVEITGYDRYLTELAAADAKKLGASVAYVRTGMEFSFVDTTLEILLTPEQIYKDGDTGNFNETSVVSRIKNEDGSMIFLGDCGKHASEWLVESYGSALKSDMVQMAHHGCENATAALYDNIAAPTVFWPCNLSLLMGDRNGVVKQHVIEAEYSKEHLLHDYGRITRALSYRPNTEYKNLMPTSKWSITGSGWTENVRLEDGVLRYDVKSGGSGTPDPYVYFNVNLDTTQYNAIKLVVDPADIKGAVIYYMLTGDSGFAAGKDRGFRAQGTCAEGDDKMTIILYLGNISTYTEGTKMTKLRIDLGDTVGETIDIYSVEAYYVAVDK